MSAMTNNSSGRRGRGAAALLVPLAIVVALCPAGPVASGAAYAERELPQLTEALTRT
jgi:hypothetical protein